MNSFVKEYKDNFLKKQKLTYRKFYLSDDDNRKLLKMYKKNKTEIEKEFKIDEDFAGRKYFYTENFEEVTDQEITQFINMKLLQKLDDIDEKLYGIKCIIVFWLVLTILIIVFLIYGSH